MPHRKGIIFSVCNLPMHICNTCTQVHLLSHPLVDNFDWLYIYKTWLIRSKGQLFPAVFSSAWLGKIGAGLDNVWTAPIL